MAKMPSVMSHDFSKTPKAEIPRSSFDRSHGLKTAFDAGQLIPIFIDEALPGDTFNLSMTGFGRLATPLHPFMDNIFFNTFFFAVPMRLVWDNWQKFNGEQTNPGDSTDYLIPQMISPVGGYAVNSIQDYFGIPTGIAGLSHSCLPFRAYNLVWNEWFRDQNLQDSVIVPKGDGPDDPGTDYFKLLHRGKRHDYFTSSLPWPQKGPGVDIPLGTTAPVIGIGKLNQNFTTAGQAVHETGGPATYPFATNIEGSTADTQYFVKGSAAVSGSPEIYADLTQASAATINQLRQAFQIQKLYERDARGGTRYTEIIRAHFNVVSPDARLQRPEYLGGGQSFVNLYQVAQTSQNEAQPTPQGNLAAYGTTTFNGHGFTKSFTEHCLIIGVVAVRADLNYQQGLNRMWSRRTKFDFYWPALAMIGEQAVLNKEIYATGTPTDDEAWGYQERFAEYRYKPSIVTGEMRSSAPQSLDTWHLAQDFGALPHLDAAFIEDRPPVDRVLAVLDEPQFIFDSYFKLRCARPMPLYGVPGLIDHF
ncbi:major capsid protein [Blackfly microvirus SF02]|uniref:Major capsid protein n=1 Tax=Blackfly microvirus SF02 TaxID=2576452 RepID=A0A4P8PU23_9VIRU|nr:major capsid protein [Blackfly microvirus SF02]